MNTKIATAGNAGPKVRSDCEITLEIRQKGGIVVDLRSKVKALYGESIQTLCREVLDFYRIRNAFISIEDSGALPFVITARLEAAIRKITAADSEFLPQMLKENLYGTATDRTRFSRLYLPGNNPGLMINAGLHSANGIILDLEDSVASDKKDEARLLVRNALRQIDFKGAERMVRINQGETGLMDLQCVIPHNVNIVLIPKCETSDQIKQVEEWINEIRRRMKIKNRVLLMPIVESAAGVENCYTIARASKDIVSNGLHPSQADTGNKSGLCTR
ncbi:MAG: aldolase/citrate lyase family protein [Bacteroidia bacterium]|nr:aldolase/citrate lyase family protein [Bacteroidia bacterium]